MVFKRIEYQQLKNSKLGDAIDLASTALGSSISFVTNEFFAAAINMLNPAPPIHAPGRFIDTGAWMDGWETKRHNPHYDWAIIQLGFPGSFVGFDIDTHYFTGNQAPYASVEGANIPKGADVNAKDIVWTELLPKVELPPSQHNVFVLDQETAVYSHLRLNNIPDGGIARFRAYGHVFPVWPDDNNAIVDLGFCGNGARVVQVSNQHYTPGSNVLLPGRGKNMGDGWETKRSRTPGHTDHLIVRLGARGHILKAVIDTSNYCGNYPNKIVLQATVSDHHVPSDDAEWVTLVEPSSVGPHDLFYFDLPYTHQSFTHVKLVIIPDGGVKRLRLYGVLEGAILPQLPIDIGQIATVP